MADPRLLFVCPSLATGGAERQLSTLVPLLRARGFDPAVLVLRERGRFFPELEAQGVPTHFANVRSRFDLLGVRRALDTAGSWPDLVITQGLDAQLIGSIVARRARAPHVTVLHKQPELRMTLHRRFLARLAARGVDHAVAVSAAQVPDLVSQGVPKSRIQVIPNGVPEPGPTRPASLVRAELGLDDSAFVALLAATLRPEKRAAIFAQAVSAAHRMNPRVCGLVAGNGPDLETVRERASDAVLLLGERTDLPDLMSAADVVCLTSSAEALPMVVLEAMAMGRPVVATNVGGVADLVVDGTTGILTAVDEGDSLTDALCRLAADPGTVAAMGRSARLRHADAYSADVMADRYATFLHDVLDAH